MADIVISRAGASTVSELTLIKKPAILVPSPNVAANHQYKNAKVLKDANAAELIEDSDINTKLVNTINNLINDESKLETLKTNIKAFANPNAIKTISNEIIKMASTI
jgi:UDP-N-acetylglucosamine--N-acetylmuramyl-(pentapeptide) pyrophosphoryl-undecaprenol N-acetylglucosamine transferase